jgi:hypothetical protein
MANEFKVKKGLIVIGSGSNILDIQGSQGQLFSVTDSLSGSLFSVNDISGLPILKVFSDDSIRLGTFNNEAIIVSGNTSKITGSLLSTNGVVSGSSQIGEIAGLQALTASFKSQSILSGSGLTNYVPIYNGTTALSSSIIFQSTGSIGTSGKGITIGSDLPMYKFAVNTIGNTYFGVGYNADEASGSVAMTVVDSTYVPKPLAYVAASYKWYAASLTNLYDLAMVIQSSSLNVGFGSITNPLHKVDISGSARVSNGMTVSGSLNVSGSSHRIQNGYVILQQVSQSLNFVDDAAASAGGVPLGGLYRNGNFIVIRIV